MTGPAPEVLSAFGCTGVAQPLGGGQRTSWLVDGLVLKPAADAELQQWLAAQLGTVERLGFRLAEPVPTAGGVWTIDGWSGTRYLAGREPDPSSTADLLAVLAAGRAFHQATARLSRPGLLDRRTDRWAIADRMAWDEQPLEVLPELAELTQRLQAGLGPLGPSQLIHGDLTGNVLLDDRQGPAIIDVAPYWRPVEYADGIVLADAITWYGAPASLGVPRAAVARGLLFRLLTTDQHARTTALPAAEVERYRQAVTLLGL